MEFVSQMGLIAIARGQSQLRPIERTGRRNQLQRILKALKPAIEFRGEPYLLVEQLGKSTAAQASLMGQFAYFGELGPERKLFQGIPYRSV
ncbi:MAG TPA: hypothetical protein VGI45_13455 [Terracidiphilus sp.]